MKENTFCLPVYILLMLLFFVGCSTSTKALQKGHYRSAINLAYKEYTKDPQNRESKQNLLIAADTLSQRVVANATLYDDEEINEWKRKRTLLYDGLATIGNYNIKTNGLISESYDHMCDAKYEVDISIVDYYYQYGVDLLQKSINTGNKELAREAYDEFALSEDEEARLFYHDLDTLYTRCIVYGSIFVEIPNNVVLKDRFLKEWSRDGQGNPDCTITTSKDRVGIDVQRSTHTKTLSKTVVTGTEPVLDTAGVVVRHKDIETEVFAYENVEEIKMIASARVYVKVKKNTEHCYLESYTKTFESVDDCENITYTGDERARKFKMDSSCNEFFMKNDLRRDVESDLNSKIRIY